MVCANVNLT